MLFSDEVALAKGVSSKVIYLQVLCRGLPNTNENFPETNWKLEMGAGKICLVNCHKSFQAFLLHLTLAS
jgi:hypothetical protein